MFKNCDLILLRHTQAYHNRDKKILKTSKTQQTAKSQFRILRADMKYHDQHITLNGQNQCREIADILDWETIGVIFVSPMRRCLDTCRNLIKYSGRSIQVIVQPSISAKVSNTWSIGTEKQKLEQQYPQFKFSCLASQNQRIPWYLKGLNTHKQRQIQKLQNPTTILQHGIKQDMYQFRFRVQKFKKILQSRISNYYNRPCKRILIISHNKVFTTITAKFFDQKGRSLSDLKFQNGQVKYIPFCKIFHPLCPSPSL